MVKHQIKDHNTIDYTHLMVPKERKATEATVVSTEYDAKVLFLALWTLTIHKQAIEVYVVLFKTIWIEIIVENP